MQRAARLIAEADGLLVTAGAGMGVDSGLPDFRGTEGFWTSYPALASRRIDFRGIAAPRAFVSRPEIAWGFYGHRLALYRETVPHTGFQILKELGSSLPGGVFVVTSNVDGQFQKAGFSDAQVWEIHGSIHRLQCAQPCTDNVWSASEIVPITDDSLCKWVGSKLPSCPRCRKIARPNIFMFDDFAWINTYATIGRAWFDQWIKQNGHIVVLEIGAGVGLSTIRRLGRSQGATLIRINPQHDSEHRSDVVQLNIGALDGLRELRAELSSIGFWPKRA